MVFIEAPSFTRCVGVYLADDGCRQLQRHLLQDSEAGEVIPVIYAQGSD